MVLLLFGGGLTDVAVMQSPTGESGSSWQCTVMHAAGDDPLSAHDGINTSRRYAESSPGVGAEPWLQGASLFFHRGRKQG